MQDTAGEAGTSSQVIYSNGPPYMAKQKQVDQLEHTYSSYVRIRDPYKVRRMYVSKSKKERGVNNVKKVWSLRYVLL